MASDAYQAVGFADGGSIGTADGTRRLAGRAVHNHDFLGDAVRQLGRVGEVCWPADVLSGLSVPHGQENTLQIADSVAVNASMDIVPFAYLG